MVEFAATNELEVISSEWLKGATWTYWPTHIIDTAKLERTVQRHRKPGEDWVLYEIARIFGKSGKIFKMAEETRAMITSGQTIL